MSKDKDMIIYFVLPTNCEDELSTSEAMQQAFELCRQNHIIPEWISEKNCLTQEFNRKDVIVFEKFEGEIFQKVQTRLSIAGPWCIIACLLEGLQIPSNKSAVYNMAMNKLTITASNFTVEEKKKIKERVEMMGGFFILNLTSHVTHLITKSVRTNKCSIAYEKGVHVMLSSWVEDVWKSSLTRNVKATDSEFEKHKCPCFYNMRICTTGYELSERDDLQKKITQNGGLYSGKLLTATTDILLCKPGIKSEKFEVAKKSKVPCVRTEWIYDSEKKGFPLPETDYLIEVVSSTPTKDDAPLNPDFSMMSTICNQDNNDPNRTSVSATFNASLFNMTTSQSHRLVEQKENQQPDLVAEIDLQTARKAGTFLDGCGILLAGFTPVRREKLCRILRSAGATRYDIISDRVTQVLVGDPTSHEVRLLSSQAPLVSAAWLVESIRCGCPAPEEPYIIQSRNQTLAPPTPSSPLSKKGLSLLQSDTTLIDPEPAKEQPELEPEEHESIQIYKSNQTEEDTLAQLLAQADNINTRCETKDDISALEEEDWSAIFENKTFKLIDQTEEESKKLIVQLEAAGGIIVDNNYKGVTDYAVMPSIVGTVRHAAAEVVSALWILDCFSNDELLVPDYYHQLLSIAGNAKPLEECVITISGYAGYERLFLIILIRELGAVYQDKFAKIAKQNILCSTHLICLGEVGSKWDAAKRWERFIVTHKWLLRCAETGQRAPEQDYLLGKKDDTVTTPEPCSNKRDFEGRRISPSTSTSIENKNTPSAAMRTKVDITPALGNFESVSKDQKETPPVKAPMAIKTDIKTPESPLLAASTTTTKFKTSTTKTPVRSHINIKTSESPIVAASRSTTTFKTPVRGNINEPTNKEQKPGEDVMITLEDGIVVPFSTYMDDLRAQGLFDTPSPLPPPPSGTPIHEILARLRREGKLPDIKSDGTPTRSSSDFGGGSQGTPVGRYLRGLQERNVLPSSPKQSPVDSSIPRSVFDVKTPETPLGRFLEDDPSPSTRKHWQRCLNRIPHYQLHDRPAAPPRRPSTPWSEVKRQAWAWLLRDKDGDESAPASEADVAPASEADVAPASEAGVQPPEESETQQEVRNQIGELQDMLKRRESSGPSRSLFLTLDGQGASTSSDPDPVTANDGKDSQTDTVGWDEPMEDCVFSETTEPIAGPRKFMMSAFQQPERDNCCRIIRSLGGEVSELTIFDNTATHVVCSNPVRNEKIMSSMAAGLWVLHHSYLLQSADSGRFLPEAGYAFGNPEAVTNLASFIEPSPLTEAMHWWCGQVRQTGKGAFHSMRAILFVKNTAAVVRLIEAGGGTILQASPPFAHSLDISHCFIDAKMRHDYNDFIPLAEQGVPCLSVLYLSSYLTNRTNVNVNEFIISALRDYYN